jgi:DNA-binding NarL/FixJ family response regulator
MRGPRRRQRTGGEVGRITDISESERPPRSGSLMGVVIVEPFPVIRAGLVRTIGEYPGLEILADVAGAEEAMAVLEGIRRNRVVIIVAMGLAGERDAYWLIRGLRERYPGYVILGMGANADPQVVSRALFVGADGFIDKSLAVQEFLSAIQKASEHEVVIMGPAAASVGEIAEGIERRRSVSLPLTRREREVLTIAAEGLTAREIAERLGVRERTVTTHLARIYGKLGVGSRLAALRVAARSGLVSMGPIE